MHVVVRSAALLFLATVLGAMGAHALRERLAAGRGVDVWETAVLYHLVHGLALLAIGIWGAVDRRVATNRLVNAAGWWWTAGIVAFSGSLYALSLGGPRWLGPVTPLGGLGFLTGWLLLAIAAARLAKPEGGSVP